MALTDEIQHLKVLEVERRGGPIGYFDLPVQEIGELTLSATVSNDSNRGQIPSEDRQIPKRRTVEYVLGKSINGNIVIGDTIDEKTGLVKKGYELLEVINYRRIAPY